MLIGVPKEIKTLEFRVGLTPSKVRELVARGHRVLVEHRAGAGIGHGSSDYRAAGAEIAETAAQVWERAELVVKVKEPQPAERALLREGQVLITYLHLAPDPGQARDLIASGATCIAYETVTSRHGTLPLLAPMSEVAGRMAVQAGAHCLEKEAGGRGVLLGGVPGVTPGKVVVLGGGVVGSNATQIALGMGADVTVMDRNMEVLRALSARFGPALHTVFATAEAIEDQVARADLVVGAVLVPGAEAPKLVSEDMVRGMRMGSALVDVAIDQGGCFATSRPTTHAEPTFMCHEVVHYCVANMPGAVPYTSTYALSNVTLPFVLDIAGKGWKAALEDDAHLRAGLNVHRGMVTHPGVAESLGVDAVDPLEAIQ